MYCTKGDILGLYTYCIQMEISWYSDLYKRRYPGTLYCIQMEISWYFVLFKRRYPWTLYCIQMEISWNFVLYKRRHLGTLYCTKGDILELCTVKKEISWDFVLYTNSVHNNPSPTNNTVFLRLVHIHHRRCILAF